LWQGYRDLSLQAQGALVKLASGNKLLLYESMMRKLAALKAELMGESPSSLERLLAGRIAACWLQVSYYDGRIAKTKKCSPADYWELNHRWRLAEYLVKSGKQPSNTYDDDITRRACKFLRALRRWKERGNGLVCPTNSLTLNWSAHRLPVERLRGQLAELPPVIRGELPAVPEAPTLGDLPHGRRARGGLQLLTDCIEPTRLEIGHRTQATDLLERIV
jgi:hypothetical protein